MSDQREKQQEKYVTWAEAVSILNIKRTGLDYYIRSGQVETQPGQGQRDRRYRLEDILKIKERREQGQLRKPYKKRQIHALIDWMQVSDIPAGIALDIDVYKDNFDPAKSGIYQAWRKNNSHLTMAAFTPDRSKCLAYVQLIPLKEQVILDILSKKRSVTSIQPDEVLSYDRLGGYILLAVSATCHEEHPELIRRILHSIIDFWIDQYPARYVTKVYAQAATERGDKAIQHFFMQPRYDLAENAFELNLARPALAKLIQGFQEQLKEKAPLPSDLQWPPALSAK